MKITYIKQDLKSVCFKDLKIGECFEYHEDVYIRIPSACQVNQTTPIDAFCITTGKYDWFTFEDVIPLESTLVLKYKEEK